MQLTTHQLAKKMLEGPDIPVAVQRNLGVYQASVTEFRVDPRGNLLFDSDKPRKNEKIQQVFWLTGSPFI